MKIPQKIKNRTTTQSTNPFSGYISEWIERRVSKRYLHAHVHCSIIHNSQEVEATQMSIDGWTDKQSVVYTCNGIGVRHKKEGNSSRYTTDESWHYAKWNKLQPSKDKYSMIPLMRYPKWSNSEKQNIEWIWGKREMGSCYLMDVF